MLLLFILFSLLSSAHAAIDCPAGYFPIKSHSRNAYKKQDGTSVSATTVKEQCRPYRTLKTPDPKFFTSNWPNPNEKFKAWKKEEETEIRKILSSLPKTLSHVGEIKFYRSNEKSPNPAVSNSENKISGIAYFPTSSGKSMYIFEVEERWKSRNCVHKKETKLIADSYQTTRTLECDGGKKIAQYNKYNEVEGISVK